MEIKMNELERLTQTDEGRFYRGNIEVDRRNVYHVGRITTLTVPSPCLDISEFMRELANRDSAFIPTQATAYVASDFSGDTQHVRESGEGGVKRVYSVYAIQFYYVYESLWKI